MNRKDYGNRLSLSRKEKMTAMLSTSVIHFYISNPQNSAQNNLLFFHDSALQAGLSRAVSLLHMVSTGAEMNKMAPSLIYQLPLNHIYD